MNNYPNNRPKQNNNGTKPLPRTAPKAPVSQPAQPLIKDRRFFTTILVTSVVVLVLITSMLVLAVAYVGRGDQPATTDPITNDNQNDVPANTSSIMLKETEDMGQDYIDSMIFFGDSNTDHLRSYGMLSGGKNTKQVWSTKSQTVTLNSEITNVKIVYPETGEEMTVAEAAALKKPEYLVISLGTNGVAILTETQFKYCYKKLINAVKEASPNTKIIIQTIYPVTSWYTGFSNEKINTANEWILDVAEETGVRCVDTASVLKDANGAMIESYNSDHTDGYHVNAAAYTKILEYLRTHGYQ